jgi:hypothetical protein
MNTTSFDVLPNYEMLASLDVPIHEGGGYALDECASDAMEEALAHFLPPEVMEAMERYRLALSKKYGHSKTLLCALAAMAEPFSDHPTLLRNAACEVQSEAEQLASRPTI